VKHSYYGVQPLVSHGACDTHGRNKQQADFRLVMVSIEARDHIQYLGIVLSMPLTLVFRN
jgi:hypothetical protein